MHVHDFDRLIIQNGQIQIKSALFQVLMRCLEKRNDPKKIKTGIRQYSYKIPPMAKDAWYKYDKPLRFTRLQNFDFERDANMIDHSKESKYLEFMREVQT